jgi:hypothetical protein
VPQAIAAGPLADHIPGAGINFADVGSVHLVRTDHVGTGLVPVSVHGVEVGDLLVTLASSPRRVRLGRPMQVLHRGIDGAIAALDDRSLPRSVLVTGSLGSAIEFGEPATAWQVLAAFGIGRCPRCQTPGLRLAYGLLAGPPSAGYTAAGCSIPFLPADLRCPRCHAVVPSDASQHIQRR